MQRLFTLGYHRTDVVAAAGEFAVRGGLVDVWAATADAPARVEFFGDEIESMRSFELGTQRSTEPIERLDVAPWSELPREPALRERVIERISGTPATVSAARAYLAGGADVPEAWLSLAYDQRETLLDYVPDDALVVLDEPAMLATVERGLEDERSREEHVLLAAVESGELSVDEASVGEALLADVTAPHPSLADLGAALASRPVLILPGAIEGGALPWLPRALETFVLETRPVEHFNRQLTMFLEQVKAWVAAGETVALVASGASRLAEMLRASNLNVERSATLLHLRQSGSASFLASAPGMSRVAPRNGDGTPGAGTVFVDVGSIESGFAIPGLRLHVLGDREIYGQPPKRVKLRAVKEGVPVTLADLRVGDHVVHAVHGIGQYLGLRTETILGATQDYLDLKYAGTDRMLVPVTQMHQVTKYGAAEGAAPRLSKMGGADWARTKSRVSENLAKIADGLVALYAEREMAPGHAFASRHALASRTRRGVSLRHHARSTEGYRRRERRHGARAPDGPPRLRRRRLRQDRSRRARRVQSDRRQEASGRARADDLARRATSPHVRRALRQFSGADRRAVALQNQKRTASDPARPGRRKGRHRRRHAPALAEGRRVRQPRLDRRRRRTALRRHAQGTPQGDARDRRRDDAYRRRRFRARCICRCSACAISR